jgi:predicted nuclease of predicted toxin-antitoxin system
MKIWMDAQLSPALAVWVARTFDLECVAVRDLGHLDAEDVDIFFAARAASAVMMNRDFVDLLDHHGPPPQIIWITLGNTTNRALREVFTRVLPEVIEMVKAGEPLVEVSAAHRGLD